MEKEYRYNLERGSKKHRCPECGKRRFVRYLDKQTGEYLPEQYGRCDRESKCPYHLNPYKDGFAKMIWQQERGHLKGSWQLQQSAHRQKLPAKPTLTFIPKEVFRQTLQGYKQNTFLQNLLTSVSFPFDTSDLEAVISQYYLGTVQHGYRTGAVTFPFIDVKGNVRAIQVKQFDKTNHTTSTDFLHAIIKKHYDRRKEPLPVWLEAYKQNEKIVSCLFGEHLLSKYPFNPVALVEAPKGAVYGTLYFGLPDSPRNLLWLAVYNKSSFSFGKIKVLQGRNVYTFPDLSKAGNTYSEWQRKAKEIENKLPGTRFVFSDLLERLAPKNDKAAGNDIADYLIKQDWRLFRKKLMQEQPEPAFVENKTVKFPFFMDTENSLGVVPSESLIREKCEKCEAEKTYSFLGKAAQNPIKPDKSNTIKKEEQDGLHLSTLTYSHPKETVNMRKHEFLMPASTKNLIKPDIPNVFSLTFKKIIAVSIEVQLPEMFGYFKLITLQTATEFYDVLFTGDGEPVQHRTNNVLEIESYFSKWFYPASLDGIPCLIHQLKSSILPIKTLH